MTRFNAWHGARPRGLGLASGTLKPLRWILEPVALLATLGASVGCLAADPPAAVHQHAHVHGVAKLGIAVQDGTVTLTFESPLDSLIGFEHRPGSSTERAAVAALQARMQAPAGLFRFNPEAACALVKTEAESAIFKPASAAAASDEHADLDATFDYACSHADKLMTVDIGLLKAYPKLRKVDVEVATDRGQSRRTLTSEAHVVALSR